MIAVALALSFASVLLALATVLLSQRHIVALIRASGVSRREQGDITVRHMDAMKDLVVAQAEERREAAQERTVLLNRIQDPVATAMTSNVMLTLPVTSEDLSLEPDH